MDKRALKQRLSRVGRVAVLAGGNLQNAQCR